MTNECHVSKEQLRAYKAAQWEGFKQLARRLRDHHVLATELVRTRSDETAAVITIALDGEPVQYVVLADARGRVKPGQDQRPKAHHLSDDQPHLVLAADDGALSPELVALGEPPIKQPPTPGVVALASAMLSTAFDLAENVPPGA